MFFTPKLLTMGSLYFVNLCSHISITFILSKMSLTVMHQVLPFFWRQVSTAFISAFLWSEFSLVILELDNG